MNDKKSRPKSQTFGQMSPTVPPHVSSNHHHSQGRKNGHNESRYENEWELRERELAEARSRTAQMEKTMRWWSDTSQNWKQKWSQVRGERNSAREELKLTKLELDKMVKESQDLKKRLSQSSLQLPADSVKEWLNESSKINSETEPLIEIPGSKPKSKYISKLVQTSAPPPNKHLQTAKTQTDDFEIIIVNDTIAVLEENVAHLTKRLEDSNRMFIRERQEKLSLIHTIESMQRDFSDLQELYDGLKRDLHGESASESMDKYFNDPEDDTDISFSLNLPSQSNNSRREAKYNREQLNHEYANPKSLINQLQSEGSSKACPKNATSPKGNNNSNEEVQYDQPRVNPSPIGSVTPRPSQEINSTGRNGGDCVVEYSNLKEMASPNRNEAIQIIQSKPIEVLKVEDEEEEEEVSEKEPEVIEGKENPVSESVPSKDEPEADEDNEEEEEEEEEEFSSDFEMAAQAGRDGSKKLYLGNKAQSFSNDNEEEEDEGKKKGKDKETKVNAKDCFNSTSI